MYLWIILNLNFIGNLYLFWTNRNGIVKKKKKYFFEYLIHSFEFRNLLVLLILMVKLILMNLISKTNKIMFCQITCWIAAHHQDCSNLSYFHTKIDKCPVCSGLIIQFSNSDELALCLRKKLLLQILEILLWWMMSQNTYDEEHKGTRWPGKGHKITITAKQ